ncbi:hypothetical protein [Thiohalorhabdus sp.]|uniref:hypothetical protein n=1 Tax=Thiohalorhabdus sp. TaxID=3094134 RepID=UPI002FC31754
MLLRENSQTFAAVTFHYLDQFKLQVRHVITAETPLDELGFEFASVLSDFFSDGERTGMDFGRRIRARDDALSLLPMQKVTSPEGADNHIAS